MTASGPDRAGRGRRGAEVAPEDEHQPPDPGALQSLTRGLAVLRAFGADRPAMPLAELARVTGLSRATARRVLLTLEHLGYVRRDAGGDGRNFLLTPRVLELGYAYLSALGLPAVARPHLEALSHRVDESTSVSVLEGADIVYVARCPTRRIMTVSITVGTRFPAYATSMGRVLLAALPPGRRAAHLPVRLTALTAHTTTDPATLAAELDRVGEQGWSLVDSELEEGLRSLAAPVRRGPGGPVVAAVNIAVPVTAASTDQVLARLRPPLAAAAAALSADLGALHHSDDFPLHAP